MSRICQEFWSISCFKTMTVIFTVGVALTLTSLFCLPWIYREEIEGTEAQKLEENFYVKQRTNVDVSSSFSKLLIGWMFQLCTGISLLLIPCIYFCLYSKFQRNSSEIDTAGQVQDIATIVLVEEPPKYENLHQVRNFPPPYDDSEQPPRYSYPQHIAQIHETHL